MDEARGAAMDGSEVIEMTGAIDRIILPPSRRNRSPVRTTVIVNTPLRQARVPTPRPCTPNRRSLARHRPWRCLIRSIWSLPHHGTLSFLLDSACPPPLRRNTLPK